MDATIGLGAATAASSAQHQETSDRAASAIKQNLLERFAAYLDSLDAHELEEIGAMAKGSNEGGDLASVFVELAALRSDVRTQSRLVKDALDQFRSVFDALQISHASMDQELKRARKEIGEKQREILKPLLLSIIDVRDRLIIAIEPGGTGPRWYERLLPTAFKEARQSSREGIGMIVRRLDRILAQRGVVRTETVGRAFNPRNAAAVARVVRSGIADGQVIEEVRPGFLWNEELLRPAEVIVVKNKNEGREGGI
jgi:molecular chaperone GrpE